MWLTLGQARPNIDIGSSQRATPIHKYFIVLQEMTYNQTADGGGGVQGGMCQQSLTAALRAYKAAADATKSPQREAVEK